MYRFRTFDWSLVVYDLYIGAIEISGPTDFQHLSHLGYDDVAGTAAVSKAEDSVPSTPKGTDDGQHQRPHAYETDAFRIPAPPVQPPVDSASVVPTPGPPAVDSDGVFLLVHKSNRS